MPEVSVLMNCLNGEEFIEKAIQSVLSQSFEDFEIVFVDNCSTDNTANIVNSFTDSRIKYFKTSETIPLYGSRNFGSEKAQGKYLCFLDADDFWVPSKLQTQIETVKEKDASMVYSNFRINLIGFNWVNHLKANIYYARKFAKRYMVPSGYRTLTDLLRNYDINMQTVMIDSACVKKLKFNPSLNLFGDADLFFRYAKDPQSKIFYDRRVTSFTSVHSGQLSRRSKRDWYNEILSLLENQYATQFSKDEIDLLTQLLNRYSD